MRDQNEPTTFFANWDFTSNEERMGDALRAFGQILGLELEHRHPNSTITQWATENKIEQYWVSELGSEVNIDWAELREYVFTPLSASNYNIDMTNEYDPASIMIWAFPRGLGAGAPMAFNNQLSTNDIEFIKELYPIDRTIVMSLEHSHLSSPYSISLTIKFKENARSCSSVQVEWLGHNNTDKKVKEYFKKEGSDELTISYDFSPILKEREYLEDLSEYVTSTPPLTTFKRKINVYREMNDDIENIVFQALPMNPSGCYIVSSVTYYADHFENIGIRGQHALKDIYIKNPHKLESLRFMACRAQPNTHIDNPNSVKTISFFYANSKGLPISDFKELEKISFVYSSVEPFNFSQNKKLKSIYVPVDVLYNEEKVRAIVFSLPDRNMHKEPGNLCFHAPFHIEGPFSLEIYNECKRKHWDITTALEPLWHLPVEMTY